jgi:peroxiredoxin
VWSHDAWSQSLQVDVPLLSDWNGEVARGFDVVFDPLPLAMADVPMRTAFLIEDGERVVAAWMLGRELPDIDAIVAEAQAAQTG